jgi:hypothetical protein
MTFFNAYLIRAVLSTRIESGARFAYGATQEQDSGSALTFSKNGVFNGFVEDDLHTLRKISASIEPN